MLMFCKLQKVNLLVLGEHTELLVLNCYIYIYIYKFSMILKLPISHRYCEYRSLDRYPIFYGINGFVNYGLF
ncbi:hypothetical protein Hanom_Chr17g01538671 [Helianthus anomalus]